MLLKHKYTSSKWQSMRGGYTNGDGYELEIFKIYKTVKIQNLQNR
jgi:hypothetical protein